MESSPDSEAGITITTICPSLLLSPSPHRKNDMFSHLLLKCFSTFEDSLLKYLCFSSEAIQDGQFHWSKEFLCTPLKWICL